MMTIEDFLELSLSLVGFGDTITLFDLYGTGNVELYHEWYHPYAHHDPRGKALINLWYLGVWENPLTGETRVTEASWRNALVWKAMGAAPFSSKPPGFAAWSLPPMDSTDQLDYCGHAIKKY
jgi:hypothetical protein